MSQLACVTAAQVAYQPIDLDLPHCRPAHTSVEGAMLRSSSICPACGRAGVPLGSVKHSWMNATGSVLYAARLSWAEGLSPMRDVQGLIEGSPIQKGYSQQQLHPELRRGNSTYVFSISH